MYLEFYSDLSELIFADVLEASSIASPRPIFVGGNTINNLVRRVSHCHVFQLAHRRSRIEDRASRIKDQGLTIENRMALTSEILHI